MTKDQIFEVIKRTALEVVPTLRPEQIRPDRQLKDLGVNSIDRVEIVSLSMEAIGVRAPLMDLAGATNLGGLVDLLHARKEG